MSSDFKVGDEVVCIDTALRPEASRGQTAIYLAKLTVGQTYIIGDIRNSIIFPDKILIGIEGIYLGDVLYGYDATRFRKVEKKFTGMETLRGLLKTKELVDG